MVDSINDILLNEKLKNTIHLNLHKSKNTIHLSSSINYNFILNFLSSLIHALNATLWGTKHINNAMQVQYMIY